MIGFLFIVWNGIDNILARQFIVVEFERKNLVFYLNENAIRISGIFLQRLFNLDVLISSPVFLKLL